MRLKWTLLLLAALVSAPVMASTILSFDESGNGALNGDQFSLCDSTGTNGCLYRVAANVINGGQLYIYEPDILDIFGDPALGDVITFNIGNPGSLYFASANYSGFTAPADTYGPPPDSGFDI